jgi:uncharacterized protein (DUF924 family)
MARGIMRKPEEVLSFWFVEHGRDDWFGAKPEFDAVLAGRFAETHARLAIGEGFGWRLTAAGRLAEIIVLDQFSRQLHRGLPKAFAQDGMALVLAQEAVAQELDRSLAPEQRMFLYMPFMHSESVLVHEEALPLFAALGLEYCLKAEEGHLAVLRRFGRYPKRNAVLGRASTPDELAHIDESGNAMF